MEKPYYQKHVFVCENLKEGGGQCCGQFGSAKVTSYMKNKLKSLDEHGPGKVRINRAGCLGRCEVGPVMVVYPEGVWYNYIDNRDVDEIIEEHLLKGRIVERLALPNG